MQTGGSWDVEQGFCFTWGKTTEGALKTSSSSGCLSTVHTRWFKQNANSRLHNDKHNCWLRCLLTSRVVLYRDILWMSNHWRNFIPRRHTTQKKSEVQQKELLSLDSVSTELCSGCIYGILSRAVLFAWEANGALVSGPKWDKQSSDNFWNVSGWIADSPVHV